MLFSTAGAIELAHNGKTDYIIFLAEKPQPPEEHAANELAKTLNEITGALFAIQKSDQENVPPNAVLVGNSKAARKLFSEVAFERLAPEEIVIKSKGQRLLLAGGTPRGTIYAVNRFLQEECGVRWWTPWAARVPKLGKLDVGEVSTQTKPAFEYREAYWKPAFDSQWALHNCINGQSADIPAEKGGCIHYKGFVHTFYPLVPPEKYFAEHPEWYSLIKGKRTTDRAQLCLTNPQLRDFVVGRVKEWLRESPDARIISVSQNDWHGACECEKCKAIDDAEGSHSGTLLEFVNYIAEKIEPEFPKVAVDTLAYQYTRKPPKTLKPRPNVIVRLCSIECNFRQPLSDASNAAFASDIEGWSKTCRRLYVWDYTTDFAHYVQPHPNWLTLGPNVRFFADHNVVGLFEQGAYQSHGSEMSELRAWVLAQLLWNPKRDDRALIDEFLEGYYGSKAAKPIKDYMTLLYDASANHKLGCYSGPDAGFLNFKYLSKAEELWQQAEKAAGDEPDLLERVKIAYLPVGYVWLSRWDKLRKECEESGAQWPVANSQAEFAAGWRSVANGFNGKEWTKVTLLSEGGLTPEKFLERFKN